MLIWEIIMAQMLWSYAKMPLMAVGGLTGLLSGALYYYQK